MQTFVTAGSKSFYYLYVYGNCYTIGQTFLKIFFIICDMKHKHACTQTRTKCDTESDGKVCWMQPPKLEGTAEPYVVTLYVLLLLCQGLTLAEG